MSQNGWIELSKPQNPEAGVKGLGVVVVVVAVVVVHFGMSSDLRPV
jgi:hypothetical protein